MAAVKAAGLVETLKGKGTAEFTTVSGGKLWAMMNGTDIVIKDENGATAKVSISDVNQSNGVIHVIDHVVAPMKK